MYNFTFSKKYSKIIVATAEELMKILNEVKVLLLISIILKRNLFYILCCLAFFLLHWNIYVLNYNKIYECNSIQISQFVGYNQL